MRITVQTVVKADVNAVWRAWNDPDDIEQWNAASDDWHTTRSAVDLREGGTFSSRMEAKDGSEGFDFEGTYTRIVPQETIEYRMGDGRSVQVRFARTAGRVVVTEVHGAADRPRLRERGPRERPRPALLRPIRGRPAGPVLDGLAGHLAGARQDMICASK